MRISPLTIYLLWHPASPDAEALARAAYRWFHAPSDDLLRSGMGIPVYFRSQPGPGEKVLPRDIDLEHADLNVVVVLADANLVGESAWTAWLDGLARRVERVLMLPVALHQSAYRMPETLRRLNFLRVDKRDDPQETADLRLKRRTERLLRQLTEVVGRHMASRLADDSTDASNQAPPPPMTLFLSHAKRDGAAVAEALRTAIQDHSRLRAFFDDSDLPVGHAFAIELERAAGSDSAAMIAIVSDAYAARPWCRREAALARRPRRESGHPACWSVRPLLAVDALKEMPSRNLLELGNAPVVRWQPDQALHAVDLLMLEVLLSSYHRLRARQVPPAEGRHVISWTPDAISLLQLQREAGTAVDEVVYPGDALPEVERRELVQLFPKLRLQTFEDTAAVSAASTGVAVGRLVGLSSGFNSDLGGLGMGREHFEEITLRVARCVVEVGGRIAFGGMLRTSGLTETLLTLVRTVVADDGRPESKDPEARILSYQRWPGLTSVEQIASDAGICEYVLVESPLAPGERLRDDPAIQSPERARAQAYAVSAMRQAMSSGGHRTTAGRCAPKLDARIIAGGLRTDFNGFMPGVLEEALYALEDRRPVFVLGGFGGAAAVLARALLQETSPPELDADFHRSHSARMRLLQKGLARHGEASRVDELFERLKGAVERVRGDIAGELRNGLDADQNGRLMQSDHVAEIIDLLRLGMSRLWRRAD